MEVEVLKLPRWAQVSVDVLSTPVAMCSSGAMCGAEMWRWVMYAASSRSLMVNVPFGFFSVSMWACMAMLNVSCHMCQSLDGM